MSAIAYRVVSFAHIGKRHLARCRLCRTDIGSFALKVDAITEADSHLRRRHQEPA